ncbi:hypothetical protein NIES23_61250 (plasmid) [Trichormus variabilis NIES-23]|uniref:Uncharacterized protein n=1 Tax=Trichormus variabilis NIES-23 TaxID=1973479 RepID=A0A1Z4KWI2_ANAVA|nr:hypothetical protein NIES23_61250 [Trichormus variabilis NIES-23]
MKSIIKKSDVLIVKKSIASQSPQPVIQIDAVDAEAPIVDEVNCSIHEQTDLALQSSPSEYLPPHLPVYDSPLIQSAGNSGWQVSDIWRDLRVDDFCN